MAILGSFSKQPAEVLDFDISYTTVLAGRTDIIASKSVTVSPSGLTVVSSSIIEGGTKIKVVVSGGTDGQIYKVTVLATSDATTPLVYEDEVNVTVDEV